MSFPYPYHFAGLNSVGGPSAVPTSSLIIPATARDFHHGLLGVPNKHLSEVFFCHWR